MHAEGPDDDDDGDDEVAERALAAAVSAQDPRAVARFEARYIAPLDRALGRMKLDDATLADVKQRVRERLLLPGDDGATRLQQYAGQGRLGALVHVTATRIALDLIRARNRAPGAPEGGDAEWAELADATADPALAALARRAREAFGAAFEDAVGALARRDRALLRLHLLRGVGLEQLATMYNVHRATVVRWLAQARAALLADTRARLAARLGLAPRGAELDDVMALIESRLDVSVERVMRTQTDPDA